ncbi:MAG: STAS domain-containing protein [Phycisphaerae bacterium]|nr:STAS domain-containing protein [Phycisphaerae bacterium]
MADEKAHLTVVEQGGVNIVKFSDHKILEELSICEIEEELLRLVDSRSTINLLLNFQNVEHLSSAALGMLIKLKEQVSKKSGRLKLSDIRPQIYQVFKITQLNKLFDIHPLAADALKSF